MYDFDKSVDFVFRKEGYYSNDPDDRGGVTKYGISKKGNPDIDVENLTIERAKEIYRERYWKQTGCDDVPSPLNFIIFDTAVNCGVETAKRFLSQATGHADYLFLRLKHYSEIVKANPVQLKYLRGWVNRTLELWSLIKGE